jgi:hypothetical protein
MIRIILRVAKVHKRASNVMKLAQENEKLRAELKGMTDRLEAAERKRLEIARRQKEQERVEEVNEEDTSKEAKVVGEANAPLAEELADEDEAPEAEQDALIVEEYVSP